MSMKDGEASNPLFNVRKRNEGAKKDRGVKEEQQ